MAPRHSAILALVMFMTAAQPAFAGHWTPPIGIPAPPFGIEESATDGAFTHWVDNSGACSDAGNGTPTTPRCTLPGTLSAGNIVQIRGGPYLSGVTTFTLGATGTAASPVYFRGPDAGARPELRPSNFDIGAGSSYLIVENVFLNGVRFRHAGVVNNISFRNSEQKGRAAVNCSGPNGTNLIWYNVHIHDCGTPAPSCDDKHGIGLSPGSRDVWIVDSEINGARGDGIQFCHFCAEPGPRNVYIGRNVIHDNAENGVDLKTSQDVIISQNEFYGHRAITSGSCSSDGVAILIGSNGLDDQAVNIWALFNNIHDNDAGIRIEAAANGSGVRGPAYLVGNVLRNLANAAFKFDKDGGPIYVVNNTVVGADRFLDVTFRQNFDLAVFDNVVVGMTGLDFGGNDVQVEYSAVTTVSDLDRTLFYQDGNPVHILWATLFTYSSTSQMATFPGGANNRLADPLFVNRAGNNFRLQTGSPAIDRNDEHAVYGIFQNSFGRNIRFDFDGVPRPRGLRWDTGAFEFGAGSVPTAPTNLQLH